MTNTVILLIVWNCGLSCVVGYLLWRLEDLGEIFAELGKAFIEFSNDTKRNLHIVHTQGKGIKADVEAMRKAFKEFTED